MSCSLQSLAEIGFEGSDGRRINDLKAFVPVDNFEQTLFDEITPSNNLSFTTSIIKEPNGTNCGNPVLNQYY
jgi:hypothetical protein